MTSPSMSDMISGKRRIRTPLTTLVGKTRDTGREKDCTSPWRDDMSHPETDTPQDEPVPNETELKISVYHAQSGIRAHYTYRRKVSSLLRDLNLDPETVLVIQNNVLLTADERLDPLMEVEIRPVISAGSEMSDGRRDR